MQLRIRSSEKPKKKKSAPPKKKVTAIAHVKHVEPKRVGPVDAAAIAAAEAQNKLVVQTRPLVAEAQLVKVTDLDSQTRAGNMLVTLADWKKKVSEQRDYVVKPLKEHVKRLDGMFKPVLEQLEEADELVRRKILAFRQQQAAAAEKERQRLMAEAEALQEQAETLEEKGKGKQAEEKKEEAQQTALAAVSMSGPAKTVNTDEGAVGTTKRWTFEVEDVGEVPREYLKVDEVAIRRAVSAGARSIPGVRIFEVEGLRVGGA